MTRTSDSIPAAGRGRPVTRQVVDSLYQLLRSGDYVVGARLPSEWELAGSLHVGRSAVREAIRELVALGLVELRPGRGTYVRSLRPDLLAFCLQPRPDDAADVGD